MQHRNLFVEVGDSRLECRRLVQDGARLTIVFLHEGLGSVAMWRDFPERLCAAAGCNGLIYSRRGYGRSTPLSGPRLPDFMHREARDVLPALLDQLDIAHPVLFGHSDGGSIALLFAAIYPERPSAITVLAPHIFVEDLSVRSIEAAATAYAETGLRDRLSRYHDDVDGAFRGWNDIWLSPEFRNWNIEACLSDIRCRVLAIQGQDDEYGTMAQIDGIAKAAPQTRLLKLPECGHSPHKDQPQAVIEAVVELIGGLSDAGHTVLP